MAPSLEDRLAALEALRADPSAESAVACLGKALRGKNQHLVAKAAEIVGDHLVEPLAEDLIRAFPRFLERPAKTDTGCRAKAKIAEALYRLRAPAGAEVFLPGIRFVQMEPTWGGQADTAAPLRGWCAFGLVGMSHPNALGELARLLADREVEGRIMAARALAYSENPAGGPLLRLRLHLGDDDARANHEYLTALLALDPRGGLDLAAERLAHSNLETARTAADALAESRPPEALGLLQRAWEQSVEQARARVLLSAAAVLRTDAAIDWLLELVADGSPTAADDAEWALAMYEHDTALQERLETARQSGE